MRDTVPITVFGGDELAHIDDWYSKFTLCSSFRYVVRVAGPYILAYFCWALACYYLSIAAPNFAKLMHASFTLKVLTFLVGILISLTLKEALDRYRACLAALIDFRDEFRSFWYFLQLQLLQNEGARLVFDLHMVAFAMSVIRFILRKEEVAMDSVYGLVQKEFRQCCLFEQEGVYASVGSNPEYFELLVVAWLRSLGVMDRDVRLRWQWARGKLHTLITAQRVRSPKTSAHLLRAVVHVFLLSIPVCSESVSTKLATPVICMVLMSLLELAEELEDPFGLDEHDLPWPVLLATVTRCRVAAPKDFISGTIAFFNESCRTGEWDEVKAKRYFGDEVKMEPETTKAAYDSGKIHLSLYLTEVDLKRMDVVGNITGGDPDVLFANSGVR